MSHYLPILALSLGAEVWNVHPVRDWSRRDVFCLQRLDVEPHPAYRLLRLAGPQVYEADEKGGPRVSCLTCIFAPDHHLLPRAAARLWAALNRRPGTLSPLIGN